MIRIVIADDHPLVRAGLRQTIEEQPDMEIVAEASTSSEACERISEKQPDLAILDISMPGRGGIEVLKQLRGEKSSVPVLMLTMHSEEQYAVRALKAGAMGYLTKESISEELIKAIRKISSGRRYISETLSQQLASNLDPEDNKKPHESLSDREFEVFLLLAGGKQVGEVAEELSLSVKTISTYRTRLLEKMGMRTNSDLTVYAVSQELLSLER